MMQQRCPLAFVWVSWAVLLGGLAFFLIVGEVVLAGVWLVAAPLFQWAYIRTFPKTSRLLGYGTVADRPPGGAEAVSPSGPAEAPARVTFYVASLCPFCPILRERLEALRERMGFEVEEVDVTLRPGVARARGIRSVPVVEAEGRRLVGHATSEELADFLRGPVLEAGIGPGPPAPRSRARA